MRVAALYDIHGMLGALDAVLAEVEREDVGAIVIGGDVVGGPQPAEVLARLRSLDRELVWIRGNGDRALGPDGADAVFSAEGIDWTSNRLTPEDRAFLAELPPTAALELTGLGPTLFCHGTPRSDLEIITPGTPEEVFRRVVEDIEQDVVVCGHTHMQLDRRVGGKRWINAGSVGMPYEGEVAAFWAVLGPDVEFRRTPFDTERAAEAILASGWPEAESFVAENVREAVPREEVIPLFEQIAADRGER